MPFLAQFFFRVVFEGDAWRFSFSFLSFSFVFLFFSFSPLSFLLFPLFLLLSFLWGFGFFFGLFSPVDSLFFSPPDEVLFCFQWV